MKILIDYYWHDIVRSSRYCPQSINRTLLFFFEEEEEAENSKVNFRNEKWTLEFSEDVDAAIAAMRAAHSISTQRRNHRKQF